MWNRLYLVHATALAVFYGFRGFSCEHDCGPHASCRCGVCVGGPLLNQAHCDLEDCTECNVTHLCVMWLILILFIIVVTQFLYSILRVLLIKSRRTREKMRYYLGAKCCLCDSELFTPSAASPVSLKRFLPWLTLSPYGMLTFSVVCLVGVCFLAYITLRGVLEDVWNTIPEEFYASDHLLIYGRFLMTKKNEKMYEMVPF